MIQHELLLLGLLRESPRHGYDIKKKIKEILFLFAGVDLKSIYYPLRILEQKGLILKRINKQGRRPQRFIYELTKEGQARFDKLVAESFFNFKRPQFSLDLSLYFLPYINRKIAQRRLRGRTLILKKLIRGLREMVDSLKKEKSLPLVYISEHNLQMVETEYKFLSRLTKIL